MLEGIRTRLRGGAAPDAALTTAERYLLILFAVVIVVFGCIFELRTALLKNRKGDLNVFLRAAWAVRAGEDIYTATDDNDHHYHYPPFLAVMLVPLADPPAGRAPLPGTLPFPVSVATWYALSILLLALALDTLATALEETLYPPGTRPMMGSRRWWALRICPLLVCLPAIGGALMRGQVDMILLALFCGMAASTLRGRSTIAGLLLSVAISIKVIPAFLLLYPLWKRDTRWLASCGAGLVLCLGVVPIMAFGPKQAVAYYREWDELVLRPGLTEKGDQTRAEELTHVTGTDSQSFLAVMHNWRYPAIPRPPMATPGERRLHWAIAGALTMITIGLAARAGRRGAIAGPESVLLLGALILMMNLSSPVCHLHYFSLSVPLVMAMMVTSWPTRGRVTSGLLALFAFNFAANALPRLPGLEITRDVGLATSAALALWGWSCVVLWKSAPLPALSVPLGQPKQPGLAA
jgi:hypothetical protein